MRTEYRLRHKDGHYVWLETISSFLLNEQGQLDAIVFTARDITERIETQKRLDQTQHYYHTLVESVDGMIWEMDAETYYEPTDRGYEKRIAERMAWWDARRAELRGTGDA